MGGKSSRTKGASAEREFAAVLKEHGYAATRNRIGISGDDLLVPELSHLSFEVKRQEKLCVPAWLKQAEQQAGTREPVLVFRQNGQPWRAVVRAEHYLSLLSH